MKLFTLLLLGFALSIALPARPANANDPETRTARRHFDKADKLFALGRFDEALEQYEKAFDAKPIPDFLFNIGQCYRNLGDYEAAIFSFRKFLTLEPETPRRAEVELLIDELEAKKAQAEMLARDRKSQQPKPTPRTPVTRQWWFWTGLAALAAAGGGTVYFLTRDDGLPASDLGNINFPR